MGYRLISSVLSAGETFLITSKLPFVDNSWLVPLGNTRNQQHEPHRVLAESFDSSPRNETSSYEASQDWKIIVSDAILVIEEIKCTFRIFRINLFLIKFWNHFLDHPSRKFLNSYFRRSLLRERILFYISIDKFRLKICIISFYIFIQENNLRTMAPVFQSGRDLKFRNSIFLGPLRTKKESDFFAKNIILFLYVVSWLASSLSSSERD